MTDDAAIRFIKDAQASLDKALAELAVPPAPTTPPISTPADFDKALAAATAGSVIVCATTLRYPAPLNLTTSGITIRSERTANARMTADEPCPSFTGAITMTGEAIMIDGIEATNPKLVDVIVMKGGHPALVRCRLLGDPTKGTKRGIAGNAANVMVSRCYVDYMHGPYPGGDTQAFCAWDTPGPITLLDNYFCGGSETVMIGGSDPSSEANIPSNIVIRSNTITKRPEWMAQLVGVKNTLELKNARFVLIEDNDIWYSWGGHGQDGFAIMLTVRNQGGKAPYSTVEGVEIINNRIAHCAAAFNILGTDNLQTSQRTNRILIRKNLFEDIDPQMYAAKLSTGSNKMMQVLAGPLDVTIDDNEFHGVNIGSDLYFDGSPQCEIFNVTNNKWPKAKYGPVFGSGVGTGLDPNGLPKAWNKYVKSGTLANNVEIAA